MRAKELRDADHTVQRKLTTISEATRQWVSEDDRTPTDDPEAYDRVYITRCDQLHRVSRSTLENFFRNTQQAESLEVSKHIKCCLDGDLMWLVVSSISFKEP